MNEDARRVFEIRHSTIASFRRTLDAKGFIEVETPVLHAEAGGARACSRPITTRWRWTSTSGSPELHLKRLIVGGLERVFEIGRIFRNEGVSHRHTRMR